MLKKGRKVEPLGSKIHDNSKIEREIVKWLSEESGLSNLGIANRLRDKPWNFFVSAPTVGSWRINYYPQIDKKILKRVSEIVKKDEDNLFHVASTRVEQIQKYRELIQKAEERVDMYESMIDIVRMRDGKEDKQEGLSTYEDQQYESWIKTLAVLREKVLALLGPEDYFEKAKTIVDTTKDLCIDIFKESIPENKKEVIAEQLGMRLKEYLEDLKSEHSI